MSSSALVDVRTASIRVALAATAIVAAVYLGIAAAAYAAVTSQLTAQVDSRLSATLDRTLNQPIPPGGLFEPGPGRVGELPVIIWTVLPDGTILCNDSNAVLPAGYRAVTGPTTIQTGGVELRVEGAAALDSYVVVGQSLDPVQQAGSTLLVAELFIGLALLLAVFLGSVTIGRRVAAPIEEARRRQLDFTADASHELRTPLSVIEAQTTLAFMQEREAGWYRGAFQRIDRESKRMRRLLEDLLWLARFDATRERRAPEPVDAGILATQAADRFGIVAEARHVTLGVHAADDAIVDVPAEWLDRLLGVLLDNACKYAPEGGTVDVSVGGDGSSIRLTVDDSGPGIPPEERDRIFDRFHRSTGSASGAGLGLAIADAIVRATGGHWRVGTSTAGGASMSVTWPRVLQGRRTGKQRAAAREGETASGSQA